MNKTIYLKINENTITILNELLNNGYEILIKNDGAFTKYDELTLELFHIEYDGNTFLDVTRDEYEHLMINRSLNNE
jgi:hypothetical protein